MKPTLGEDVTSILVITSGAVISAGLTAALLTREPAAHAAVRLKAVEADAYLHYLHQPVLWMSGPEGAHSHWFPAPPPRELDARHYEIILEKKVVPVPKASLRARKIVPREP
jgi:hypothetical protein